MRSPAELTEAFRAQGLKVTPQRELVFRILHGNQAHPTADSVYEAAAVQMPSISLRTVYQTLNDLAAMGEIHSLDLGTGAVRFDPNIAGHHHLVCLGCRMVRDVYVDVADLELPAEQVVGFTVATTDVVFRGWCEQCAADGA